MLKNIPKRLAVLLAVILATMFTAMPVLAADLRGGETITIASSDVIYDDLYIAGTNIAIDGTVNGDIFAVGTTITINGIVNGSVNLGAQNITINGEIARSARLAGTNIIVNGNIRGDLLAVGSDINISSRASIERDLLFGASVARIDGSVAGYVRGSGSKVTVTNAVKGDIELNVSKLTITSTANLQGNLTYTSENEAEIQSGARISGTTTHKMPEGKEPAGPLAGAGGKVIAYLMTLIAGIVIILIAPRRAVLVATSIRRKPWLSLGWGAIVLFATPIAAIITLITVVGVPVGLIGLTLYGLAIYLSQIAVSLFIGHWTFSHFRKVESRGILVGALALGLAILTLLKLIPYIGFPWIWLLTVMSGIGAVLLSLKTFEADAAASPVETD